MSMPSTRATSNDLSHDTALAWPLQNQINIKGQILWKLGLSFLDSCTERRIWGAQGKISILRCVGR